ncbi:AMP deaminase [Batrachochytrium salamandrivorans]|nr:AMP deaminase [Batrachochytrium salamandrivorans]
MEDEEEIIVRKRALEEETRKKLLNQQLLLSRQTSKSYSEGSCSSPSKSARVEPPASFQRVVLTNCAEDFDNAESQETAPVCQQIQIMRAMRRRYHKPCHPAPYYGSLNPGAHRQAHAIAQAKHEAQWGSMVKGEATPAFAASFPGELSALVNPPGEDVSSQFSYQQHQGVFRVVDLSTGLGLDSDLPSVQDYQHDFETLNKFYNSPAAKSVCFKRLELLDSRFTLHKLLNSTRESQEQRMVSHRDFYNVRKVDNHIHHSAIMTQKHLLRFMKYKLKRSPDEVVIERNGTKLTLKQVFESLGLTAYDLSIDHLDMHADNTFHRFDRFNLKYNPVGESRLREIFLKTSNLISGKYLAELTQQVIKDLEDNTYVVTEPRLSIYGSGREEWQSLGKWYCQYRLASPNVRWMIQFPRLYSVYKAKGIIQNFQDMLNNIFLPLFACTLNPHGMLELDLFLNQVVGFDCVDDESKVDLDLGTAAWPIPGEWDLAEDPPYAYWIYYLYANLRELNTLRTKLNKTTFSFRPHAGESGSLDHLSSTYLVAESINHGVMLRKSPPLQYLYYLDQIGLAVSPLSNNSLFVAYESNPFPHFFSRGLFVTISTDDPLLLHLTKDPLVEEYSVAKQVWKLSSTDMCEIARNSVAISGLEHPFKRHYLGDLYFSDGVKGNNIEATNVPDVRVQYRSETLQAELEFVTQMATRQISSGGYI